ncbi:MAG: DUF922 domain-containing Zn-dependent protease [Pseudomonadota bacterium]|nr:DUF922 domain-containing Zn-dependent protease [Pseudomonadota bacterium]
MPGPMYGMEWLLVLAMTADSSLPQLRIEERTEYYDVAAKDRPTLIEALRVPGTPPERYVNGQTNTVLEIDRRFTQTPRGCVINALSIRLELLVILPRWAPGAEMPRRLEQDWNEIHDRIVTHENKHKQNALDAAFAMHDGYMAAVGKQDCRDVEKTLHRAQAAATNKQQLMDRLLDQKPVLVK